MSSKPKSDKSVFIPTPVSVWLGSNGYEKEYKVTPATWASLYKLKSVFRELLSDVTDLWNQDILSSVQKAVKEQSEDTDKQESKQESKNAGFQELLLNENLWKLVDKLLEKPYDILSLAIPDLDPELFKEDNANGATIPQVWATLTVITQVNQLDIAKNLITGKGLKT